MRALTAAQGEVLRKIFAHLQSRDGPNALVLAKDLVSRCPDAPDAQHAVALALAACGCMEEALPAFEAAARLAPRNPLILANVARHCRRMRLFEAALKHSTALVSVRPSDPQVAIDYATDLSRMGQHEQAIEWLRPLAQQNPADHRIWLTLGQSYRALHALELAADAYRQALALNNDTLTESNLASVLRMQGKLDQAIVHFGRALSRRAPLDVELAYIGSHLDRGDVDGALDLAEQALVRRPDVPELRELHAQLHWLYADSGRAEAVTQAFERYVDDHAVESEMSLALIRHLLEIERVEDAAVRIEREIRRRPSLALHLLAGETLVRLGRPEAAGEHFGLLAKSPDASHPRIQIALVRFAIQRGEFTDASDRISSVLTANPSDQEAWAYQASIWRAMNDEREFWLCDYDRLIVPCDVTLGTDLAAIKDWLESLHGARHAPPHQSLRQGTQTEGNLFGRNHPMAARLEGACLAAIEQQLRELKAAVRTADQAHPFLRRLSHSVRFKGSWSVRLTRTGRHVNHFHQDGWLSSALYISLPPGVAAAGSRQGCLQFGQAPPELGLDQTPRRIVNPVVGRLVLFPSYLWHGTTAFDEQDVRLTVAFDAVPRSRLDS